MSVRGRQSNKLRTCNLHEHCNMMLIIRISSTNLKKYFFAVYKTLTLRRSSRLDYKIISRKTNITLAFTSLKFLKQKVQNHTRCLQEKTHLSRVFMIDEMLTV